MKKYLFGLGAMLVGAGLMFVFTHTELNADTGGKPAWAEGIDCQILYSKQEGVPLGYEKIQYFNYCKIKDLTCVATRGGTSCVKS